MAYSRVFLSRLAACFTLLSLVSSPAMAAWPLHPNANVPVCRSSGSQYLPVSAPDGAGGAIIVWTGGANEHVRAQRVLADGTTMWPADGVELGEEPGRQYYPEIVPDGIGGAIVVWEASNNSGGSQAYAQRISSDGYTLWGTSGLPVCNAAGGQSSPRVVAADSGGAFVVWNDGRRGLGWTGGEIFAQRIGPDGTYRWSSAGMPVGNASGRQDSPCMVRDGSDGIIVGFVESVEMSGYYVLAQNLSAAGDPQWGTSGALVHDVTSISDIRLQIVPDAEGGAILVWATSYYTGTDGVVLAQRVDAYGDLPWGADGVSVCAAPGYKARCTAAADGVGGAVICWVDGRNAPSSVCAQRISSAGEPLWSADGVVLFPQLFQEENPVIASDGAGGALVAWDDSREGSSDIYMQRISTGGTRMWAASGLGLSTAAGEQRQPCIANIGGGNVIVAWGDARPGSYGEDIFCQRIGVDGAYTGPEPAIIGVRDVPSDQGGKLRIKWRGSYTDSLPSLGISTYGIWRQVDESSALRSGNRALRTTMTGSQTLYWEGVGTVAARGESTYTFTLPSGQDSTAAGNPRTVLMVDAHAARWPGYFSSTPDSGYSVDNLAPPAPGGVSAQYAVGTASIHWGLNSAPDFSTFRIYRGASYGFAPGLENMIAARRDTGYVDHPSGTVFYRISAVDVHGNESPTVVASPVGMLDASEHAPLAFSLERVGPNPARINQLSVAFTLPSATPAQLELLDVGGRRVWERSVGTLGAGRHVMSLGEQARLRPGVYLVRITQGADRRVLRIVALD